MDSESGANGRRLEILGHSMSEMDVVIHIKHNLHE
jgi:hypothetical protein